MARTVQDVLAVLRGLQLIAEALCSEQRALSRHLWQNSSIRELYEGNFKYSCECLKVIVQNPSEELRKVQELLEESAGRTNVVFEGAKQLARIKVTTKLTMSQQNLSLKEKQKIGENAQYIDSYVEKQKSDAANLDISSITLKELEEILSERHKDRDISLRTSVTEKKQVSENRPISSIKSHNADEEYVKNVLTFVAGTANSYTNTSDSKDKLILPTISTVAKQRKVPSSRIGRMASFGGLFAGLGLGTINELTKGVLGLGGSKNVSEALFSPANAERIVDTLCKVRGAALKIGQILSIQDSNIVSPELVKAFERVRQAADYMPDWQLERVMLNELGPDWRNYMQTFDERPFAAASIGQVHRATLKNGTMVAVKVQYPGVAESIESDIDNLVGMLKVWDVFPHGFFIDNVVKVAKRELTWEIDYIREAEYTKQFKDMISPYGEYYVPKVIEELTTSRVLTTELVPGVPLDKCFEMR